MNMHKGAGLGWLFWPRAYRCGENSAAPKEEIGARTSLSFERLGSAVMNMLEDVWPGWNLGKSDVGAAKMKMARGVSREWTISVSRIHVGWAEC